MAVRVLQVIGGSKFGGAVWVIRGYVEALQEQGCEVTVCSSVEPVAAVFRDIGCEIVAVQEMTRAINPPLDLISVVKLARICREGRFDVVHTHTSKGGFIGRAAARLAGVPIVLHTAHGFAFHEASPRLATAFYARLERLAAHWCDRILTVSDFHRDWAIRLRLARPDQIVTVHNGISHSRVAVSRSASDVRSELGVAADDVLLVSAGRIVAQKGLGTMLQALPQVLDRVPNTRLVLAGEGPARAALEEQVRTAGLSAHVSFLGFRSDVANIVNAADIVVAPSVREGLSISVLEAMALGKPIVATTIGGNLELLDNGSCGLLVRPNEPEQLAEAVIELALDEDGASRFGAAALERFERCFTERTMKDAVWAAYRPLLEQKLATTRASAVSVPA